MFWLHFYDMFLDTKQVNWSTQKLRNLMQLNFILDDKWSAYCMTIY